MTRLAQIKTTGEATITGPFQNCWQHAQKRLPPSARRETRLSGSEPQPLSSSRIGRGSKTLDEFCVVSSYLFKYAIRLLGTSTQESRKQP